MVWLNHKSSTYSLTIYGTYSNVKCCGNDAKPNFYPAQKRIHMKYSKL